MKANKQKRNHIGFDENDFKKVKPMRNDKADAVFKRSYNKAIEDFKEIFNNTNTSNYLCKEFKSIKLPDKLNCNLD